MMMKYLKNLLVPTIALLFALPLHAQTVMVLGDSISAGYGLPSHTGWVTLLAEELDKTPDKHQVVNASISGETTGGALARLPKLLAQHKPDIVIIELGGNDGLRGFPITTLRRNLAALIDTSQASSAKVLLTAMRIPPNYGTRYTQLFYDSFSAAASKYQLPLVPFILEDIAIHPELMQADGIHPKAEAQARILQNVMPYLKTLL